MPALQPIVIKQLGNGVTHQICDLEMVSVNMPLYSRIWLLASGDFKPNLELRLFFPSCMDRDSNLYKQDMMCTSEASLLFTLLNQSRTAEVCS